MTTLRTAAQHALEAMEKEAEYYLQEHSEYNDVLLSAIEAIKAALEEPVQEPVAWIYEFYADMGHKGLAFEEQPSAYNTPLYTAPPPRKPLTEEEIQQCFKEAGITIVGKAWTKAIRAIERAHGIT